MNKKSIIELAKQQSRMLEIFSNGEIYIDISSVGLKLVAPDNMREGLSLLTGMVNGEKRSTPCRIFTKKINKFFELCHLNIVAKFAGDEKIEFSGSATDKNKLLQFFKIIGGYDIKDKDLF